MNRCFFNFSPIFSATFDLGSPILLAHPKLYMLVNLVKINFGQKQWLAKNKFTRCCPCGFLPEFLTRGMESPFALSLEIIQGELEGPKKEHATVLFSFSFSLVLFCMTYSSVHLPPPSAILPYFILPFSLSSLNKKLPHLSDPSPCIFHISPSCPLLSLAPPLHIFLLNKNHQQAPRIILTLDMLQSQLGDLGSCASAPFSPHGWIPALHCKTRPKEHEH